MGQGDQRRRHHGRVRGVKLFGLHPETSASAKARRLDVLTPPRARSRSPGHQRSCRQTFSRPEDNRAGRRLQLSLPQGRSSVATHRACSGCFALLPATLWSERTGRDVNRMPTVASSAGAAQQQRREMPLTRSARFQSRCPAQSTSSPTTESSGIERNALILWRRVMVRERLRHNPAEQAILLLVRPGCKIEGIGVGVEERAEHD